MAQRINPDTGYPMSTDKQITLAKNLMTDIINNPLTDADFENAMVNPYFSKYDKIQWLLTYLTRKEECKGDYFYKTGNYDLAEKEYFQVFYLGYLYVNRLRIIYQREKRFKDAVYILEFALNTFQNFSYLNNNNEKVISKISSDLSKAKEKVKRHTDTKSKISGSDKVNVVQSANSVFQTITNYSNKIDELETKSSTSRISTDSADKSISTSTQKPQRTQSKQKSNKNTSTQGLGWGKSLVLFFIAAFIGQSLFGDNGAIVLIIIAAVIIGFIDIVNWLG